MTSVGSGRYRLERRIASGGMGEVWQGTDTALGRTVAVKLLRSDLSDDATFRARFDAEARHAAALHDPHIATVFDFGDDVDGDGAHRAYLVMEYVDGRPLSALIRGPMMPEPTVELIAQAADGLAVAHAAGIVHRDVKPANLLVTPQRQLKITDFGVARAKGATSLTETGTVIGTAAYLAPEVAEGREATSRSDIYSLGVVLYECLAGRRPFVGDNPVATAIAHIREAPPPLPETVPPPLDALVFQTLAKDPAERPTDAAALAAQLRRTVDAATPVDAPGDPTRVLPTAAPGPTDKPPRRRRTWLWIAVAVAVLLIVGGAVALVAGVGDSDDTQTPEREETTETTTPSDEGPTAPDTTAPTSDEATTPPTQEPTSQDTETTEPSTSEPTTSEPTTSEPTTSEPTTSEPTTEATSPPETPDETPAADDGDGD